MSRALALVLLAASGIAFAADPASEEHALSSDGVAGEIMDMAVEHCRRGERDQALALFQAIRAQLDPPPAILRLVSDLEATGCNLLPVASGSSLRLQVSSGWDSNVSQGITARTLVLGSGENAVELELSSQYRPRASAFMQASVDYSLVLPRYGTTVQLAVGQRVNRQASQFDLRTMSAAASREFALPVGSLRGQVEMSEVWLANTHYQRSGVAALQWLVQERSGAWLASATASRITYITQPSQNAATLDIGLLREWRIDPSRSIHASVSAQYDQARRNRPGGDRLGFQVQAGGVVLAEGWRVRPQVSYSSWDSEEVFAPALIDVKRRNRLRQALLQGERPLSPGLSVLLEWRGRWARDSVALYRYKAQSVTATLAYRF